MEVILFWLNLPWWFLPILICLGVLLFFTGWWNAKRRYESVDRRAEESVYLGWRCATVQLESFLWEAIQANVNPEGRLLHVLSTEMTPTGPMIEILGEHDVMILRIRLNIRTGSISEWSIDSPEDGLTNPELTPRLLQRWWAYLQTYPSKDVAMTMAAYVERERPPQRTLASGVPAE